MTGTVYFIQAKAGGPIKIGYTSGNPDTRLRALQTSSPERLSIIGSCAGSREAERALHDELAKHRLNGEWFKDCIEVREAMRKALSGKVAKPRARRSPCGCVQGFSFCDDADAAWRDVGLARARSDQTAYAEAIKRFGQHVKPGAGIVESMLAEEQAA